MTGELDPGLYVVATPIGNLSDMSERAIAVLRDAAVIAAEDTRTSGKLVKRAGGSGRFVSLTEHNVEQRAPGLVEEASGSVVALVSDAGTPVIADPGARLVEAAHAGGVRVVPIPGPSALAAAISASGFEGSDVHFLGFLPRPKGERTRKLEAASQSSSVLVFFESPARLANTLLELAELFNDPDTVVCRELTKLHEEVVRGRAAELATRFQATRGECTVVVRVAGVPRPAGREAPNELLGAMKRAGARRSQAATEVAKLTNTARSDLYQLWDDL